MRRQVPVLVENFRDPARLLDRQKKFVGLFGITHRRVADGARPDRRNEGAHGEIFLGDLVGNLLQIIVTRIRIRIEVRFGIRHQLDLRLAHRTQFCICSA